MAGPFAIAIPIATARIPRTRSSRLHPFLAGCTLLSHPMKPHVAFQRSLAEQLAAIRSAAPGVCAGDAEALHAWRVAVRRLRTLLRALPGKQARALGAEKLQHAWRAWSQRLGPARDADVWYETLHDPVLRRALGATVEGRSFLRAQLRRRRALKLPLRRVLQSANYRRLQVRTGTLIEQALPSCLAEMGARRLARRARQAFSKLLSRARRGARHLSRGGDEAEVHALRRRVRRARYLSEIGGKILPAASPKLHQRLLQVQAVLGDAHDADVQLAFLVNLPPAVACRVTGRIQRRRAAALQQFRRRWKALAKRI